MFLKLLKLASNAELQRLFALFDDLTGGSATTLLWRREESVLKLAAGSNFKREALVAEETPIEADNPVSLTARVKQSQQGRVDEAFFQSPQMAQALKETTVLTYPVILQDYLVGVIGVFYASNHSLNSKTQSHLESLTQMVGTVIENLFIKMITEKVIRLTNQLRSITSLDEVMQLIVNTARTLTRADSSLIFLFDSVTQAFSFGARSPSEDVSSREPRENGLTRQILDNYGVYKVDDVSKDPDAKYVVGYQHYQSIIGIRLASNHRKMGVFYLRKKQAHFFTHYDVLLLKSLAALVSSALEGTYFFFKSSSEIEQVTAGIYQSQSQLEAIAKGIKQRWAFDIVSIQLIPHGKPYIETAYLDAPDNASVLQKLSCQGKYSIHPKSIQEIHGYMVEQKKQIVILSGMSDKLNAWRYKLNDYDQFIRIWLPILILRDEDGEVVYPSPDRYETSYFRNETVLTLFFPNIDEESFEVLGTLEVGFLKTDTRKVNNVVGIAYSLFQYLSQHAKEIRQTQLPYVLETITKQAQKVLNGDSTSLHFPFVPGENSFVTCSGKKIQEILRVCKPRPKVGLGDKAITAGTTLFQSGTELEQNNPKVYEMGVHAMSVSPLNIGTQFGVLYLHSKKERVFNLYEQNWVNLFAKQMTHVIRNTLDFIKTACNRKLLNNLHVIDQLLIDYPDAENLLVDIAGIARNILGADLISIYEYQKSTDKIAQPIRAGKLKHAEVSEAAYGEFSPANLLMQHNHSVYEFDHRNPNYSWIFSHQDKTTESMIDREGIRATAGIVLKVGSETVGMMFINYRYPHKFDEEKEAIDMFALSASIAIKSKQAYQQIHSSLQRRDDELDALRTIDLRLVKDNKIDIDDILMLVLESGAQITKAKSGSFYWYNKAYDKLELRSATGVGEANLPKELTFDQGVIGRCATNRTAILVTDTQRQPYSEYYREIVPQMRSELAVPFVHEQGLLGVLNVEHDQPNAFNKEDELLLSTFANQALIAVHGVAINEKLNNQYKSLKSLSQIALEILRQEYSLDVALQYILTGVTANEGLAFSRAMLLFLDVSDVLLRGYMAIGARTREEAEKNWGTLSATELLTFEQILEQAKDFRMQVEANQQIDTPLSLAVKSISMKKTALTGALRTCVFDQQVVTVMYGQSDAFSSTLEQVSCPQDVSLPFVCVPLLSHEKTIGILVVDNRFLYHEREADFDQDSLKAYANIAAMAVENNRLQQKLAREQKIASTKASFERLMHTIGQRIDYLDGAVDNFKAELFQSQSHQKLTESAQGIEKTVTSIKEDLAKFKLIGSEIRIRKWPVGLNHFLHALQKNYGTLVEYRDDSAQPITFYGDESYLKDALIELICNAQAAMKAHPSPKIIITLSRPTTEPWIYIEVLDCGSGIPQAKKQHLFDFDFYNSATERHGLGLTIVKEIIEAHGGTIHEAGELGEGARFIIKLPPEQIELSRISPYRSTGGVTDASVFFGRESVLSHIYNRSLQNYFLVGARQLGKTSVLKAVERFYQEHPKVVCSYLTLSGADLLEPLVRTLKLADPDQVWSLLQSSRNRLLLIDEADAFIRAEAEQNYPILTKFRALSEQGHCHFIFAGFWQLYRFAGLDYHSPIKNFGEILTLDALELDACYQLATKPMAVMNIHYQSDDIVQSMIQQTGQRPNLISIICNEILKNLKPDQKIIEAQHVKAALESEGIHQALSGWQRMNGADEMANRLDRIIVYMTIKEPGFTQKKLLQDLQALNAPYDPETIKAALARLKLAFIIGSKRNQFHYRVPLFREKVLAQGVDQLLNGERTAINRMQQKIIEAH